MEQKHATSTLAGRPARAPRRAGACGNHRHIIMMTSFCRGHVHMMKNRGEKAHPRRRMPSFPTTDNFTCASAALASVRHTYIAMRPASSTSMPLVIRHFSPPGKSYLPARLRESTANTRRRRRGSGARSRRKERGASVLWTQSTERERGSCALKLAEECLRTQTEHTGL